VSKERVIVLSVVQQHLSKAETAARRYQVSWRWVHTLVTRYQSCGWEAVEARSRRPHSNSRAVSDELRQRICTLRCELQATGLDNGPVSIAARLQQEGLRPPAFSTIRRILTAAGLITPAPKKRPKSSYRRFQCRRGASLRCLPSASHAPRPLRTTTANGWTTGRKEVWQNWPGALELLLAAQAKEVAVAWLDDAASQLRFCAAS
jgi:transposase